MNKMSNFKRKLNTIALPLWVAMVMLLASACTPENERRNRMVFGNDLDFGDDGAVSAYPSSNDIAIGGTEGSLFSNPPQSDPQMNINYDDETALALVLPSQPNEGNLTPSSIQWNGFNTFGGINSGSSPQRSYPGNSYDVVNQGFGTQPSSDPEFDLITQDFGTPIYTPLGSGWLILVAAGTGYALVKRRKKD